MRRTVISEHSNERIVLTPRDEYLDSGNASAFLEQAEDVVPRAKALVIDLQYVRFVDSVGLAAIRRCARLLSGGDCRVTVCNASPEVRVAFELVQLGSDIEMDDSTAYAPTRVQ